jgi:hypothetical protein
VHLRLGEALVRPAPKHDDCLHSITSLSLKRLEKQFTGPRAGGRGAYLIAELVCQGPNVDPSGAGPNTHKQLRLCQDNEAPAPCRASTAGRPWLRRQSWQCMTHSTDHHSGLGNVDPSIEPCFPSYYEQSGCQQTITRYAESFILD